MSKCLYLLIFWIFSIILRLLSFGLFFFGFLFRKSLFSELYFVSEAENLDFAGVQLVPCADDHEFVSCQSLLDRFGLFHQEFDGARDVHAFEIFAGFQFRLVCLPRSRNRQCAS